MNPEDYLKMINMNLGEKIYPVLESVPNLFENIVDELIPTIIYGKHIFMHKLTNTQLTETLLVFTNGKLELPTLDDKTTIMYPLDAMEKNLDYSASYTADITHVQVITHLDGKGDPSSYSGPKETKIINEMKNYVIATIPIQVKSKYCSLVRAPDGKSAQRHCPEDKGGYFIVNRKNEKK